jgi:glucose-6-phosphate isomerase
MFGAWWQQLFGASEGKDGKGLFPAAAELTGDLYGLGQMIQEGRRNLFETVMRFDPPENRMVIGSDWKNLDDLNNLEGKNLDFVEETAFQAVVSAHVDGGVPVIVMDCGELNDRKFGELVYFMELACGISAYLLRVNPFVQTGVEFWQQNLLQLLGKPISEKLL